MKAQRHETTFTARGTQRGGASAETRLKLGETELQIVSWALLYPVGSRDPLILLSKRETLVRLIFTLAIG